MAQIHKEHGPWLVAVLALLVGIAGICFSVFRPRRPDVVFVRTSDIMARYKVAIAAREAFQKETSVWGQEVKEIDERLQELAKKGNLSDPKIREQARQLRSRAEELREKGARRDQELMMPVLAEVNAGIKKFAQKNGYRMVFGTLQGGVVLHGDDALDVTEPLLLELNH